MALDGPKNIELPEIPQDFPVFALLHPLNYFVNDPLQQQKQIESSVENLCRVIPFIDEDSGKDVARRQLTALVVKLFTSMNESIAEGVPLAEGKRFKGIMGAITLKISQFQKKSHSFGVENIRLLAEQDKDIARFLKMLDGFAKYLNIDERNAFIAAYIDLRMVDDGLVKTNQVLAESAILRENLTKQQLEIKQANDELAIQERFYSFIGELAQQVFKSSRMKEELSEKLNVNFIQFCQVLESHTDIKLQYSAQWLKTAFSGFIEKFYKEFRNLELCKLEIIKFQGQLAILQKQENQKQNSPDELDAIRSRIALASSGLENNQKQIEALRTRINEEALKMFESIIVIPHRDEIKKICKLFYIKEEDLAAENEGNNQKSWLSNLLANSWLRNVGDTISSYVPSVSTMQTGIQSAAKYSSVAAVGTLLGGPLGTVAAPLLVKGAQMASEKVNMAVKTIKNTLYGEFTLKYSGEDYKVSRNLTAIFEDKAEFVNAFFVKNLFELDIALASMPEVEKGSEEAQQLNSLFQALSANYKAMRAGTGNLPKLFSDSVKMVLRLDYQNMLASTGESINGLREFLEKYQEYESTVAPEERSFMLADTSLAERSLPPTPSESSKLSNAVVLKRPDKHLQSEQTTASSLPLVRKDSVAVSANEPHSALVVQKSTGSQVVPYVESKKGALQQNHAVQEAQLVRMSQKVALNNQKKQGTNLRFDYLLTLGEVMSNHEMTGTDVKLYNTPKYSVLAQNPLDIPLEECVRKFIQENNAGFLNYWFKEKCFTVFDKESPQIRRAKVAIPIIAFNGKSIWHMLCEHPKGVTMFRDILELQMKASATAITPWKFSDYFDPNSNFQGMNPLAYAVKVGNSGMLISYLSAMATCIASFNPNEIKQCYTNMLQTACGNNNELLHNAHLFCEQLMTDIALYKYSQQSYLGVATQYLSRMISDPSDSTYMEVMSALTVRIAKGQLIPTSAEEIGAFLEDLNRSPSSCWHVAGLKGLDLGKTAKNISQFIAGRSALFDYLKDEDLNKGEEEEQFAHLLINAQTGTPLRQLTDDEQKVLVAILKNDDVQLEKLLSASRALPSMELTVQGFGAFNLLYVAGCLGKDKCAATLFKSGTPVENCGPDKTKPGAKVSALVLAASEGHPSVVNAVLVARAQTRTAGYQRRAQDGMGRTALHYLAEIGDSASLRWIASEVDTRTALGRYNFPAFCNLYDINGDSPLHLFAKGNAQHLNVMKKIDEWMRDNKYLNGVSDIFIDVDKNAFIMKNAQGLTPLMIALSNKNSDTFAFILLLMTEAKCLQSELPELAERLVVQRELDLSLIYEKILKEREETFRRDKNVRNYSEALNSFAKLAILTQNSQSLNLVLIDLLKMHNDLSSGWLSNRSLAESVIEDTLKYALEKANLNDFALIVPHVVLLAKQQGLDSHSKQLPALLNYLKGQGVDDAKLKYLSERLFEEKLIPQLELDKYRSQTPPLISPESPGARRKLTIAFDKAAQPPEDLDSSLEDFVKIGSNDDTTKDKPSGSAKKPDGKK